MRFAEVFRAARGRSVLGFATLALLAGFWRARGARTALITLLAIASTAWLALIALFALLFAGTIGGAVIELTQGAAEIFDLTFVGEFLAFGDLDEFQHFFHLIHGTLEHFDDGHHFINRLMDGGHAMLRFDAGDAFGSALDALNQRANRDGRTARRERFGRGAFRTHRTFGTFDARWRLRRIGRDDFGRGGGFRWRGCGRGGVLRFSSGCVFVGARRERLAASATTTATASASAGAFCRLVTCGFCAARNGLFAVRHSGVRLL